MDGGRAMRGYDQVEHQQCGGRRDDPARLTVQVRDQAGYALPGLHVYLANADTQGGVTQPPESAVTDSRGIARLEAPGAHYYSLLVAFVGFVPEVRLLHLGAGCDAEIPIAMRVLAVGEDLTAPSPVVSARPRTSEKGPRARVLKRIGRAAVDCGTFPGIPVFTHRELPLGAAPQVSQCMTDARKEHKAFFFTVEVETVHQWMATGLMGTDKGLIEVFWFDLTCPELLNLTRAPKGGLKCEDSFHWYPCPIVSTSEMIDPELKCQDGRVKPTFAQ